MNLSPQIKTPFVWSDYKALSDFLGKSKFSKIFILTDSNTNKFCLPYFIEKLNLNLDFKFIQIEAGEKNKNIASCMMLWKQMLECNADRQSLLVNLGGGMITDLGGFVASSFKRGISFIHIPTTLMAMVDASLGGKTGVNLNDYKNQVGVFAFPELIFLDTHFLTTLPEKEIFSARGEILKYGCIEGKDLWKNMNSVLTDITEEHIDRCIKVKMNIVNQDPYEKGLRKVLNLGHTLGHALESYSMFTRSPLPHGIAVAKGLYLEAWISWKLGFLDIQVLKILEQLIKSKMNVKFDKKIQPEFLLNFLLKDKKNKNENINLILMKSPGDIDLDFFIDANSMYNLLEDYFRSKNI